MTQSGSDDAARRATPRPLSHKHCAPGPLQYYDIDSGTKHYFYYMAASRNNPATDPVVLWREC